MGIDHYTGDVMGWLVEVFGADLLTLSKRNVLSKVKIKCCFNKTIVRPQLYSDTDEIQDSK